jgi:hypothetical protein
MCGKGQTQDEKIKDNHSSPLHYVDDYLNMEYLWY